MIGSILCLRDEIRGFGNIPYLRNPEGQLKDYPMIVLKEV